MQEFICQKILIRLLSHVQTQATSDNSTFGDKNTWLM